MDLKPKYAVERDGIEEAEYYYGQFQERDHSMKEMHPKVSTLPVENGRLHDESEAVKNTLSGLKSPEKNIQRSF